MKRLAKVWFWMVLVLVSASCGDSGQDVVCSLGSCSIGERSCQGDGVALECVDAGDGCGVFQVQECGPTQVCQVGLCVEKLCDENACEVGSVSCDANGASVVSCVDGGDGCGVEVRVECSDGAVCRDGRCLGDCVDPDQDGYGPGCSLGLDCNNENSEAYPGAAELCDGVDNDCDGIVDNGYDSLGVSCTVGAGACAVEGVTVCAENRIDTVCQAVEGAALPVDLCGNGEDDDCDGIVDEGFDRQGETCTTGQGVCATEGTLGCSEDGLSLVCGGDPLDEAREEVCDGLDNDCDGEVDEDFPSVGGSCVSGEGLCGGVGTFVCSEDGTGVVCDAESREPLDVDLCGNNIDDDCDGEIDEGYPDFGSLCGQGQGACRAVGVFVCAPDRRSTVCSDEPTEPAEFELCGNLIDDDCDGEVDEGFRDLASACNAGDGACGEQGVLVCGEDALSLVCSAQGGEATDEVCDGLDNDCDGEVDEGFGDLGEPCRSGEGFCAREGSIVCAPDGQGTMCNADPGDPRDNELCGNGVDDDCDGLENEGFEAFGEACTSGLGICERAGNFECSRDGLALECDAEPGLEQAFETCDGLDNTCDGRVDEDDICGPPCTPDLNEPNDLADNATILRDGDILNGTICYYDVDQFDLGFIPSGEVLAVNVLFSHEDGDITVELSRDGEFVASATSFTDNERIFFPVDRAGNYSATLAVFNNSSAVDYRISTQLGDPICEDDVFESNNTREDALPLEPEVVQTMRICPGDSGGDWFELGYAEVGERLDVNAQFVHSQANIDLLLWRDGFPGPVTFADSSTDDEELVHFVTDADRYFVQVLPLSGVIQGASYTIEFERTENACQADEFEPNNTQGTATGLNLAQTAFGVRTRELQACEDDADWFMVGNYGAGDVIQVIAQSLSEQGELRMKLWRGSEVVAISSDSEGRPFIRYAVDTPGNYHIEITSVGGNPDYRLHVPVYEAGNTACVADRYELDNFADWGLEQPQDVWLSYTACPFRIINGTPTADNDIIELHLLAGQTVTMDVEYFAEEGNLAMLYVVEDSPGSGTFSTLGIVNTFEDNERLVFTADRDGLYLVATFLDAAEPAVGVSYRVRYSVD